MQKTLFVLLCTLLLLLGLSAIAGGGAMFMDSDGSRLGMYPEWLQHSPFDSYRIPGLLLFIFSGVLPLLTFTGLLLKPKWQWAHVFNLYADRYWAWTYSLYSGIILIIWIAVQLIMTPYFWLQPVMIFIGVLIIILTLTPAVMNEFETDKRVNQQGRASKDV